MPPMPPSAQARGPHWTDKRRLARTQHRHKLIIRSQNGHVNGWQYVLSPDWHALNLTSL